MKSDLKSLVGEDQPALRLTATNSPPRGAALGEVRQDLRPATELDKQQGLGVWVRGDGKGEVLNFQVQSPTHIVGALGEHYVTVDFEGWRYFEWSSTTRTLRGLRLAVRRQLCHLP